MNQIEEEYLVEVIKTSNVIWINYGMAKEVTRIGPPLSNDPETPNWEPSLCAFCNDGTYVALYNEDLENFAIYTRLCMV